MWLEKNYEWLWWECRFRKDFSFKSLHLTLSSSPLWHMAVVYLLEMGKISPEKSIWTKNSKYLPSPNSIAMFYTFWTLMKSGGSQNVSKFQGHKWFKDSGTVVGSSKGPETAEKTGPPCFSRLDKPDWYMIQTVHAKYCILHWIKFTNLQLRAKTMTLSQK